MRIAVARIFARVSQTDNSGIHSFLRKRIRYLFLQTLAVAAVAGAGLAEVNANQIGFTGTVVNRTQSGFQLGNTHVQVFGAEAGVRLKAINSLDEETRLSVQVTGRGNRPVAAQFWGGERVRPKSVSNNILVIAIGQSPRQKFNVCLAQVHKTGTPVARKCFRLVVERL